MQPRDVSQPQDTTPAARANAQDALGTGAAGSSGAGSMTLTPLRDEAVKQAARAICLARGVDPDSYTIGSGQIREDDDGNVVGGPETRRAWQDQIDEARAALSTPYVTGLEREVERRQALVPPVEPGTIPASARPGAPPLAAADDPVALPSRGGKR